MANVLKPDERRKSAEYLLSRTKVFRSLPEEVRREVEREILAGGCGIGRIWRKWQVKEKYGVGLHSFRNYARQLKAVRQHAASGAVVQALGSLMGISRAQRSRLQEASELLLLGRLAEVLRRGDLEPEQLVRLADALAKQRTAAVKAEAQRLAERKFRQLLRQMGRNKDGGMDERQILDAVRRLYGVRVGEERSVSGRTRPDSSADRVEAEDAA